MTSVPTSLREQLAQAMANAYPIDGVTAENEAVDNLLALGDVRHLCPDCKRTFAVDELDADGWHYTEAGSDYGACPGTPRRVLVLDHPDPP